MLSPAELMGIESIDVMGLPPPLLTAPLRVCAFVYMYVKLEQLFFITGIGDIWD